MRRWSLATRVLVAQWVALLVLTAVAGLSAYLRGRAVVFERTQAATVQVAQLAAGDPEVVAAYASPDPRRALQPISERIMERTGLDFATFIGRDGDRLTYHRPGYVGTHYSGTLQPVWAGGVVTETSSTATAGESVRAVVPVFDRDEPPAVVGALTVGQRVQALDVIAASGLPWLLGVSGVAALLLGTGAWVGSRYLRRTTAGLGPEALARHFAVADAALLSVDEGIVLLDARRRVLFSNRAADQLLGLRRPEGATAQPLEELELPTELRDLLHRGELVEDAPYRVGARLVIVSQRPLLRRGPGHDGERGAVRGARDDGSRVVTLHDHTAVQALAGELATTRSLTQALRAQNHDHNNRLHTLLSLLELGRNAEAKGLLTASLGAARSGGVEDADAVLTALLHGKVAEANERGVSLETRVSLGAPTGLPATDVVGIFGNLLDNAIDAAAEPVDASERWVRLDAFIEGRDGGDTLDAGATGAAPSPGWLVATVANGGAIPDAATRARMFTAGFSTKPDRGLGRGQGLAIVAATVGRLGGTVEVDTDSGTVFTVEIPLVDRGGEHSRRAHGTRNTQLQEGMA